ncbi:DNA-3-methyladenine glycosylase I [Vibrio fluvialis]|uniref:3-methyladenine DNA glycosylase n=3 Tax=Vibrio fluvialis TaxID=676 RepID=A0AAX2LV86_VIBFL|nr:DNA-3-methyladenine glycosylase I [Vibrio fluvialis]AMF92836.1 3-methyladenine DNA glycosylase [Vibrio fluvialis]EKO3368270.1 DNA-3-methyladenine glycosylase I [Vibrio fluvialis]EKO3375873.1 DNA-3-methyladenine glycosylase I [Vibrio fluvialis]EKO3393109.1 DNA-3-methyladenine glycosylase I [Vibrio fluvialis]EKO3416324.1 DNA-3-methyladenine glycosylase I [Vibrio fluvialis]
MTMEKFQSIYQRAAERKGGEDQLESLLKKPLSKAELAAVPEDRWLSAFSMKVFQSGISWDVVRKKWPNFEELFFQFRIEPLLMLSDEVWEQKAQDPKIIRHLAKVMSIPKNARMIYEARQEHGSFSEMVANWPIERITELWEYLKKHGDRLGGNTGPYTLRQMGADTFILSGDVEAYLRNTGIIEGGKNTKRSMQAANEAFCQWQQESGRSISEISQIIAFSTGDNRVM